MITATWNKKEQSGQTGAAGPFNNGARPLVMACIGDDEPERGDSRGAAGLAQAVARQMGGDFQYVDSKRLENLLPHLGADYRLETFMAGHGIPDIAIGPAAQYAQDVAACCSRNRRVFTVASWNENLRRIYAPKSNMELVAHNLTPDLLSFERARFRAQYPQIEGPLIAVMMGSGSEAEFMSPKISQLAGAYPKVTFFLCPSRRTHRGKDQLLKALHISGLQSADAGSPEPGVIRWDDLEDGSETPPLTSRVPLRLGNGAAVYHIGYKEAVKYYNPYIGLLAAADQIIVAGESLSLVSEAVFTGKTIYAYNISRMQQDFRNLVKAGYLKDIQKTDCTKPLPVKALPPINVMDDVARGVIENYWKLQGSRRRSFSAPGAAP